MKLQFSTLGLCFDSAIEEDCNVFLCRDDNSCIPLVFSRNVSWTSHVRVAVMIHKSFRLVVVTYSVTTTLGIPSWFVEMKLFACQL